MVPSVKLYMVDGEAVPFPPDGLHSNAGARPQTPSNEYEDGGGGSRLPPASPYEPLFSYNKDDPMILRHRHGPGGVSKDAKPYPPPNLAGHGSDAFSPGNGPKGLLPDDPGKSPGATEDVTVTAPPCACCNESSNNNNDCNTNNNVMSNVNPSGTTVAVDMKKCGGTEQKPVSNEILLGTAFLTFFTFAMTQVVFAVVADSKSMIGDSAAMIVDSVTYAMNLFAERRKKEISKKALEGSSDQEANAVEEDEEQRAFRLRVEDRSRRRRILQLETIPPLVSVATLLIVIGFVMNASVRALIHNQQGDPQGTPNVDVMMIFALINLFLDIVNISCFARAKHLFGYDTHHHHHHHHHHGNNADNQCSEHSDDHHTRAQTTVTPAIPTRMEAIALITASRPTPVANIHEGQRSLDRTETRADDDSVDSASLHRIAGSAVNTKDADVETEDAIKDKDVPSRDGCCDEHGQNHHHCEVEWDGCRHHESDAESQSNLNMCSAYTHVFADTLRSLAVIIAAVVAKVGGSNVSADVADSTAAVVVSILILFTIVPLVQGLAQSASELRVIQAEERAEKKRS